MAGLIRWPARPSSTNLVLAPVLMAVESEVSSHESFDRYMV